MARFTQGGGSGDGSALNYQQNAGTSVTIADVGALITGVEMMTSGKPVQISVTGEAANDTAGSWVIIQLHESNTPIGNAIQLEASAVSENVPYALNFIYTPEAGGHDFNLKVVDKSPGTWVFGEAGGPVFNAVELTGFKGDKGAPGPQGPQGPAGDSAYDIAVENGFVGTEQEWLDSFGGTANIADFVFNYDEEGTDSTITIHNHDMVIQTTRDSDEDSDISLNSADDIWINATDDIEISASNSIYLNSTNGVYLGITDEGGNNPNNQVATIGDIQSASNLGDFVFTAGTATVNDDETLVIQANNSTTVKSQLTLNPSFGSAKLEAFDSPNVTNFYSFNPDWDSATWTVEPGIGSVINFVNAPNILNWIGSSTTSIYSMTVSINETTSGTVNGFSYNGTDVTIFLNNIVPTEDPTVNQVSFSFAVSSRIDIDYDNGSFDLVANNMDIRLTSDDDIYITAAGDDLFLRANDDIRFVARYNEPDLSEQQWTMNSEGELHFPGSGYISNPVNSSGDGFGSDTLELIPDQNLSVDQRIIIDPTSPNHIHIRAGGPQDYSTAFLVLGGEKNAVVVSDADRVVSITTRPSQISNTYQNINNVSSLNFITTMPANIEVGDSVLVEGVGDFVVGSVSYNDPLEGQITVVAPGAVFESFVNYTFRREQNYVNQWLFAPDGTLYGPSMGRVIVNGLVSPDQNALYLSSSDSVVLDGTNGEYIGDTSPGNQIATQDYVNDAIPGQPLETTDTVTFDKVITTHNGDGTNVKIGDDAWIGDVNIANHVAIIGQQNSLQGGVVLGSNETEKISSNGTDLSVNANNDIILNPGSTYAYIGTPQVDGSNRIAKMSDISGGGTGYISSVDTNFAVTNGELALNQSINLNDKIFIDSNPSGDWGHPAVVLYDNTEIQFMDSSLGSTSGEIKLGIPGDGQLNVVASNQLNLTASAGQIVLTPGSGYNTRIEGNVLMWGNDQFINGLNPENQIATIGDIDNIVSNGTVRYSPTFTATGLEFTGSGETYPTYNSYYVKSGSMVSFVIEVDLSTVTNFGTGQYKLQLPFTPAFGFNHFSGWAQVDTTVNPDITNGHVILNVDHAGVTDVLDLHYLKQAGGAHTPIIEGLFLQGTPATLTTSSKIYINGTYIMQGLP